MDEESLDIVGRAAWRRKKARSRQKKGRIIANFEAAGFDLTLIDYQNEYASANAVANTTS